MVINSKPNCRLICKYFQSISVDFTDFFKRLLVVAATFDFREVSIVKFNIYIACSLPLLRSFLALSSCAELCRTQTSSNGWQIRALHVIKRPGSTIGNPQNYFTDDWWEKCLPNIITFSTWFIGASKKTSDIGVERKRKQIKCLADCNFLAHFYVIVLNNRETTQTRHLQWVNLDLWCCLV